MKIDKQRKQKIRKITNESQFDEMMEFMGENADFAANYHMRKLNKFMRLKYTTMWSILTKKLNLLGPPTRSTNAWQQTWAHHKRKCVEKCAKQKIMEETLYTDESLEEYRKIELTLTENIVKKIMPEIIDKLVAKSIARSEHLVVNRSTSPKTYSVYKTSNQRKYTNIKKQSDNLTVNTSDTSSFPQSYTITKSNQSEYTLDSKEEAISSVKIEISDDLDFNVTNATSESHEVAIIPTPPNSLDPARIFPEANNQHKFRKVEVISEGQLYEIKMEI